MASPRKICIVTGSRAEYGLLYWLMKEIAADPGLELQIIATGMHLSPEFGLTYQVIEADGFRIDGKVEILLSSDTPSATSKSIALGTMGMAEEFLRLTPDLVVVLGDRFEILAAAQAALICKIPLAHLHGGETTEGAYDESIRHAVTKMAHYHFVSAEAYRKRVVQMGEHPSRVFNVGAPGLEHLMRTNWAPREELENHLGIRFNEQVFLVTYHPATLGSGNPSSGIEAILGALEGFPKATVIFTYPNADTGGRIIIKKIDEYLLRHPGRTVAAVSLGQRRYLSLMRMADVVIGNSSSALIESPALKRASVNVGDRQNGRLKAGSVIDATEDQHEITSAIQKALTPDFKSELSRTLSLYGDGETSKKIVAVIKGGVPDLQKRFFDIEHGL